MVMYCGRICSKKGLCTAFLYLFAALGEHDELAYKLQHDDMVALNFTVF